MNKQRIAEILCAWKWADKSVDSVIEEIRPLFIEEKEEEVPKKRLEPINTHNFMGSGYSMSFEIRSFDLLKGITHCFVETDGFIYLLQLTADSLYKVLTGNGAAYEGNPLVTNNQHSQVKSVLIRYDFNTVKDFKIYEARKV